MGLLNGRMGCIVLVILLFGLFPRVASSAESGVTFVSEAVRLTAHFENGSVRLVLSDEREVVLPRAIAASGARYSDGTVEFWNKGDEARLELDGRTYHLRVVDPSTDPWETAKRRGVHFRAIGQEPGWFLEIWDGERIRLTLDYGETEIVTPVSPPMADDVEGSTVYQTLPPASPLDITVTIRHETCYDVMSGEGFPFAVSVKLGDGKSTYQGCGRRL